MVIRDAAEEDLPGILEIHNDAIRNTTANWTEAEADLAERAHWLAERRAAGNPVLVAVDASAVLGFASYGPWRAKSGYRHTVENSVYVHPAHRGRGVATALLTELITRARHSGRVHAVVAGIEASNTPSVRLHERFGFRQVARLPEVGTKFGRWLDLLYLQLLLDPS